jgi:hypothetical protein
VPKATRWAESAGSGLFAKYAVTSRGTLTSEAISTGLPAAGLGAVTGPRTKKFLKVHYIRGSELDSKIAVPLQVRGQHPFRVVVIAKEGRDKALRPQDQ